MKFFRRFRLILITGVGLVLIWIAILIRFQPRGSSADPMPPDLAPLSSVERIGWNWKLRDLDGRTISFEQYRGKAILLNFWAPWCVPCLDELPSIDRLAANPRLKDAAILCVSTEGDGKAIAEIAGRLKLRIPLFGPEGSEALVPFSSGTRRIAVLPTTYLIAADGRIMSVQEGAAQWDDPSVIDALERLIRGSSLAEPDQL